MQAIHGVGIDWTFVGEAVEYGGFLVRVTAVLVSLGGMLVTALMLGLVSGDHQTHAQLQTGSLTGMHWDEHRASTQFLIMEASPLKDMLYEQADML